MTWSTLQRHVTRALDRITDVSTSRLTDATLIQPIRATAALLVASLATGVLFATLWVVKGDVGRVLPAFVGLSVVAANLAVLRRTHDVVLVGSLHTAMLLVFWVLLTAASPPGVHPTYGGFFTVMLAAGLTLPRWPARLAMAGTFVVAGATVVLVPMPTPLSGSWDPQLIADRVGQLFVVSFLLVLIASTKTFLDRLLDQTSGLVGQRLAVLGSLSSERSDAVGTALAEVAHDLANPLTFVQGGLELALEADAEERLELLEEVRTGLLSLGSLIDGLQQRMPRPVPVSVADTVAQALRVTANRQPAGLEVQTRLDDAEALVFIEPVHLERLVNNLLTNAYQALRENGVRQPQLAVRTEASERVVRLTVGDNGPGIPASIRHRVTEPFFTTRSSTRGTGLGLSICARIVEELEGTVTFGDSPLGGAEVLVVLPRFHAQHTDVQDVSPVTDVADAGLSVLIVDDEPALLRVLARGLAPMRVTTTTSGREAVELCRTGAYDVVLCDIMMPAMSGPDVYDAVRAFDVELARRFVFLTGGTFTDGSQQFAAALGDRLLHKPIELDVLRERLRSAALQRVMP